MSMNNLHITCIEVMLFKAWIEITQTTEITEIKHLIKMHDHFQNCIKNGLEMIFNIIFKMICKTR